MYISPRHLMVWLSKGFKADFELWRDGPGGLYTQGWWWEQPTARFLFLWSCSIFNLWKLPGPSYLPCELPRMHSGVHLSSLAVRRTHGSQKLHAWPLVMRNIYVVNHSLLSLSNLSRIPIPFGMSLQKLFSIFHFFAFLFYLLVFISNLASTLISLNLG